MSRQPFDPHELDTEGRSPVNGDLAGTARELEAFAASESPLPSPGFRERVMAALAREPVPTPPRTFLLALAGLRVRDAWRALGADLRIAVGLGGASRVLRLEAAALLVAVALVLTAGGGAVAVGGAALVQRLANPPGPAPVVTLTPGPELTASPSEGPTVEPSESIEPSESVEPSDSLEPQESNEHGGSAEPPDTEHPAASEQPGDQHEGSDGSGGGSVTPRPTSTPEASGEPSSSGDH